MGTNYPPGTQSIRNLKDTFIYFLTVREDSIINDIPQVEYFIYRFIVPVSAKDGIKQLREYYSKTNPTKIYECREVQYNEYAVGNFLHPSYKNDSRSPLKIKMREIPIYIQNKIRVIDFNTDKYQYGSKPIFIESGKYNSESVSFPILDSDSISGVDGRKIID